MLRPVVTLAVAAGFLVCGSLSGQTVPDACASPVPDGAIRLALHILDPDGTPFTGIASVSIRGKPGVQHEEDARPRSLEYWYCSEEFPRGRYTVEVRASGFDCTGIRVSDSETGLLVRTMRLREDPWLPRHPALHGFIAARNPVRAWASEIRIRNCGVIP